jgi:hypothetical protein
LFFNKIKVILVLKSIKYPGIFKPELRIKRGNYSNIVPVKIRIWVEPVII